MVQGHHGIGFATAKPAYATYKSPYGPKYASTFPLHTPQPPNNQNSQTRSEPKMLTRATVTQLQNPTQRPGHWARARLEIVRSTYLPNHIPSLNPSAPISPRREP
ncbi:MAG: hypothetical protein Q9161_008306 [Pseudevernia consocians]